MMSRPIVALAALLAVPTPVAAAKFPPPPGTPGGLPDDRVPLSEGPISPNSPQGAAQVVQLAAIHAERGQVAKLLPLLDPSLRARLGGAAGLTRLRARYRQLHANIAAPGAGEGAAGSIFVDVPVQVYGTTKAGRRFSRLGTLTLRRVNDVPGASAAQLRWRISGARFEAAR